MFARLTFINVKGQDMDKAVKLYKESVIPAARSQKGFSGAYLLTNQKADKGVSITLWKSENDALANEQNRYYQEQLLKFMSLFTAPPIREGYEVSLKA